MSVSFFVRNASTLACSRCDAVVSFSSSACRLACWVCRSAHLLLQAGAAGERLAGQVFATGGQRLLRLALELRRLLVQLLHLQLQALAAGRDVGEPAAYLLQQLLLLGVAVVERLARVLCRVERLVGLRPEDQLDALHDAGHRLNRLPLCVACAVLTPYGARPVRFHAIRDAGRLPQIASAVRGGHLDAAPIVAARRHEGSQVFGRRQQQSTDTEASADGRGQARRQGPPDADPQRGRGGAQGEAAPTPKGRKELAAKQQADQREEQRAKVREAMDTGDERYLPARDKGPVKRYVRDWVDSRRTIGEYMLPIFCRRVRAEPRRSGHRRRIALYAWLAIIFCMVGRRGSGSARGAKAGVVERFGDDETKGVALYAVMRGWQMRRLRLPKPRSSAAPPFSDALGRLRADSDGR